MYPWVVRPLLGHLEEWWPGQAPRWRPGRWVGEKNEMWGLEVRDPSSWGQPPFPLYRLCLLTSIGCAGECGWGLGKERCLDQGLAFGQKGRSNSLCQGWLRDLGQDTEYLEASVFSFVKRE